VRPRRFSRQPVRPQLPLKETAAGDVDSGGRHRKTGDYARAITRSEIADRLCRALAEDFFHRQFILVILVVVVILVVIVIRLAFGLLALAAKLPIVFRVAVVVSIIVAALTVMVAAAIVIAVAAVFAVATFPVAATFSVPAFMAVAVAAVVTVVVAVIAVMVAVALSVAIAAVTIPAVTIPAVTTAAIAIALPAAAFAVAFGVGGAQGEVRQAAIGRQVPRRQHRANGECRPCRGPDKPLLRAQSRHADLLCRESMRSPPAAIEAPRREGALNKDREADMKNIQHLIQVPEPKFTCVGCEA
jgi:hypothetical protein